MFNEHFTLLSRLRIVKWRHYSRMDPKLDCLNINCFADDKEEYSDRFSFWIETRELSGENDIKGVFLPAFGKETFTLLKILVYPKTLREASIT